MIYRESFRPARPFMTDTACGSSSGCFRKSSSECAVVLCQSSYFIWIRRSSPLKRGQGVGRAVKVKGSKVSLVTTSRGKPYALRVDSANRHDLYAAGSLPYSIPFNSVLVCDRGYDARWFRRKLNRKGIMARIPKRKRLKSQPDPIARLGRWKVERCFAWFGKFRKLEIRYEYKLSHWTSFWLFASALLWLR